ncbi:unnamed protein product [Callosobruchus maculatus]|uniref:Protein kinase domain-containing protein n=1 Tax=Callosobruchus maculatus TaxID=64391 RepID=A0A653CQV7_CALMS|nr:unnamed protein product [Callosobruchus maculatus]
MGNEQSETHGIEIEEKALEVRDFWSQHYAYVYDSENLTNLTVFVGESPTDGFLGTSQSPLEKYSKNLMVYRHPCILKYVSSWKKYSKCYLAVEEVTPLSQVLGTLNSFQILIGLHSIAKALYFLHEHAQSSHNNVCITSIYVTRDGSWKLGGMEYLCKYKELNSEYLHKTKISRYNKAVDPKEDTFIEKERQYLIDVYAFGVLVCELLKSKSSDEISTEFYEYCKKSLQHVDITQRPTFKAILEHDFFSHDFITIHNFLVELPLKSDTEKAQFFQQLVERLKCFDRTLVASLLSGLLLSRLVLLNTTAQKKLLPYLLAIQNDDTEVSSTQVLFSEDIFKKYLCPKLLEIFKVRDAQIRMVLLEHFPNFIHMFSEEELQSYILPELLVGIKDTNDTLVSVTLRTLADLIPILGAATVIGGKRAKLFHDGRPTQMERTLSKTIKTHFKNSVIPQDVPIDQLSLSNTVPRVTSVENVNVLPERPRPDGEEISIDEIEQSTDGDGDLEIWDEWDLNEGQNQLINTENNLSAGIQSKTSEKTSSKEPLDVKQFIRRSSIPDITELDIKNQRSSKSDDIDFFQDMEPVINTNNKYVVPEIGDKNVESKLAIQPNDTNEEGWGEEDW